MRSDASFADALSLMRARRSATSASSSRLARAESSPGGLPLLFAEAEGEEAEAGGEEAEAESGSAPEPGAGGEHGPRARTLGAWDPVPSRGADEVARETVGASVSGGEDAPPETRRAFPTSMADARGPEVRSARRTCRLLQRFVLKTSESTTCCDDWRAARVIGVDDG
jgi:hypothetical protein